MRENAPDGLCPVADKAPELWECNDIIHDMFLQAEGTAERVDGEHKLYIYLKPTEIYALMKLNKIKEEDQKEMFTRILILEDISNDCRPRRPKPKGARR